MADMTEYKFYSDESLADLEKAVQRIEPSFLLVTKCLLSRFNSEGVAREYTIQGFLRRLSTMNRCIKQIFSICPPDTCKLDDPNVATDAGIFLQSFYANLYGAFENLARVCVEMSKAELTEVEKRNASFLSKKIGKKVKDALPAALLNYHSSGEMILWREHLNEFRHSLAHRIPLYVPPSSIQPKDACLYKELRADHQRLLDEYTKWVFNRQRSHENSFRNNEIIDEYQQKLAEIKQKQSSLEFFCPVATHSYAEGGRLIGFHGQVVANWNTILDFVCHFLEAMQPPLGQKLRVELIDTGISLTE